MVPFTEHAPVRSAYELWCVITEPQILHVILLYVHAHTPPITNKHLAQERDDVHTPAKPSLGFPMDPNNYPASGMFPDPDITFSACVSTSNLLNKYWHFADKWATWVTPATAT